MLAASLKRAVRLHATSPLNGSWTTTLARALSSAQPASKGDAVTFLSLNNLADNPGAVKTVRRHYKLEAEATVIGTQPCLVVER
jgi:hypothetical protein